MSRFLVFIFLIGAWFIGCSRLSDPSPSYTYRIPENSENDISVSSLEAEGIDESLIIQMTEKIRREDIKRIDGVLMLRHNKLVYEEYFHGHDKEVLHNFYSSAKSITSLLVGIAVEKGFIDNINQPIVEFLPEYKSFLNPDSRKDVITVADLLNMSSGLDCDDWYKGTETMMRKSRDWIKFTLDLPMVNDPGTTGVYCTGGVVTLGRIIENQSNLSLEEFANQYLFKPLNIKRVKWDIMPDGHASGGGAFFLRPRDMSKIGLLMLNEGMWNGNQIVPKDWVERCSESEIKLPGPFDGYGYLWWKQMFQNNVDAYFSSGNGGQDMFVIPSKELVLVFTSGNENTELGNQVFYMISNYLLPSIE